MSAVEIAALRVTLHEEEAIARQLLRRMRRYQLAAIRHAKAGRHPAASDAWKELTRAHLLRRAVLTQGIGVLP
jgi:Ser/Thr protein kinase RdoA (MazF antagonist)